MIPRRAALLFFALVSVLRSGVAQASEDAWWLATVQGAPVGYTRTITDQLEEDGEVRFLTIETMKMKLGRLGAEMEIVGTTRSWENEAGEMLRIEGSMEMAQNPTSYKGVVRGNVLHLESTLMGNTQKKQLPWKKGIVGSHAIDRAWVEMSRAPVGTKKKLMSFEPTMGMIFNMEIEAGPTEIIEHQGQKVEARVVFGTTDLMPGMKSRVWVTPDGESIRETAPLMGSVEIVSTRTTREKALAGFEASGEVPDIFAQSVVTCRVPIPNPRRVDEVLYRVTMENANHELPPFDHDRRQVEESRSDSEVMLRITRQEPAALFPFPLADLPESVGASLKPSLLVQSDDGDIARTAREIAGSETDAWKVAQDMERWVYEHIQKKSMDVGFASAREVFETKQGDCTEHAVLLAALCRSVGIPARVAMGFLYVQGIFGGHAWTEVYMDDWYALDATNAVGGVDAAHITMGTSNFDQDEGLAEFLPMMAVFGNVDIDVVELRYGEQRIQTGENLTNNMIQGDTYENRLLGLKVTKPEGWKFEIPEKEGISKDTLTLASPKGDFLHIHSQSVPYDFSLEDLRQRALSSWKGEGKNVTQTPLSIDGRATQMRSATMPSMQRVGADVLLGDTLFVFDMTTLREDAAQLFEEILDTVDFDVGVMQLEAAQSE